MKALGWVLAVVGVPLCVVGALGIAPAGSAGVGLALTLLGLLAMFVCLVREEDAALHAEDVVKLTTRVGDLEETADTDQGQWDALEATDRDHGQAIKALSLTVQDLQKNPRVDTKAQERDEKIAKELIELRDKVIRVENRTAQAKR